MPKFSTYCTTKWDEFIVGKEGWEDREEMNEGMKKWKNEHIMNHGRNRRTAARILVGES